MKWAGFIAGEQRARRGSTSPLPPKPQLHRLPAGQRKLKAFYRFCQEPQDEALPASFPLVDRLGHVGDLLRAAKQWPGHAIVKYK